MDLGSCARTHSTKVKNEYTGLLLRAEADKDETKIAELNRLRVEYENIVRRPAIPAHAHHRTDPRIRG